MRTLGTFRMADSNQRLLQQLLQVGLTNVDDVVDIGGAAEERVLALAAGGRGGPQGRLSAGIDEYAVMKVTTEEAKLPELIRDVLPDIGDDAVRSDDDLLTLLVVLHVLGGRWRWGVA